jgi:hypothetical protein
MSSFSNLIDDFHTFIYCKSILFTLFYDFKGKRWINVNRTRQHYWDNNLDTRFNHLAGTSFLNFYARPIFSICYISVLDKDDVRPIICEGWHFTHTWKALLHNRIISQRGKAWSHRNSLQKSNRNIVEWDKINTHKTHKYTSTHFRWLRQALI